MDISKNANGQLIQIGLNVRFYRGLQDLTQAKLAERASVSISAISRLENASGITSSELMTLLKVAIALDIHPSKLFEFREKN